jgi:hypothetical protein
MFHETANLKSSAIISIEKDFSVCGAVTSKNYLFYGMCSEKHEVDTKTKVFQTNICIDK